MTMSTNNCESMTSYFSNSYMGSDMHGHYPNGDHLDASQQMHHYGQNPNQTNMPPYPRFPPYDRMGYYNQNLDPTFSRPDSPSSQVGMQQQPNGTQMTNATQQQQPVVYASCKLQAAVGGGVGGIGGGLEGSSPPLEQMGHHMNTQMTIPHHMAAHAQSQINVSIYLKKLSFFRTFLYLITSSSQSQVHQNQHMGMYTQTGNVPPVGPNPQNMMHQQTAQMHQGQQPSPANSQNTQGSLPSPLYPWMRSQFGK